MNIRYLLPFAVLLGGVAQGAPLANLAMACPDESAIGRPFDDCRGYAYQVPSNQLIVATGSFGSAFWRRASDLSGADTVLVCTIPVEPGQYSSCRDATGARRMAFVRKDSIITGGRNSVIVSKTGGDYTDPVTAAENAFAGDTWCVAPQWPDQLCVMAIGEGIFILGKTLSIPGGLAVSGNGEGATMLVADNGVEMAVLSAGGVRISDLTIVNSQPGGSRTTGIGAGYPSGLSELHDAAVHVSGAAQNVALVQVGPLEILDSEITAVGQDTTGIQGDTELGAGASDLTLERSHVSAEMAIHEDFAHARVTMRLVDSYISGTVFFNPEYSLLEIVGSEIVGDVAAWNDGVRVVITGSSIKGNVNPDAPLTGADSILITDTNMEGNLSAGAFGKGTFDELRLNGELVLDTTTASVSRSYIINFATTAPAISLRSARVQLQHTFVQATQALVAERSQISSSESQLDVASSVLAGAVSRSAGAVLSCTDTYGADYELLTPSCQPQPP